MKRYRYSLITLFIVLVLATTSCSEEFLDRPSEDGYTIDNFYSTDEQVIASTAPMYGKMWAPFATKWQSALGELPSGNCQAGADAVELVDFKLTSESDALLLPWSTCFAVVAQANNLINNLESNVGPGVSKGVINTTIAEAHFMRAMAYFYLVRIYGAVPIIENNLDYVSNPKINTNPVEDVYKFIKMDFQYAVNNLPDKVRTAAYSNNIRLSSGSAKSLLAKVNLYTKDYAEAKKLAEEVIASGEFKLLGSVELPSKTFGDLFLVKNNNNEESIFSWQFITKGYYFSNYSNIQYGIDALNEATYGGTYVPTKDIQKAFEPGDLRRKETYMVANDFYPNLASDQGASFLLDPTKYNLNGTGAFVKKYVVGKQSAETGPQDNNGSSACMYIMRYADLLLIHAEAILGNNAETSDAAALNSYNKVRNRAGLNSAVKITQADIIHERRVEFAFEGEYWYDLCRIPRAVAIDLISKQDRSYFSDTPKYVTPVESDFVFPKPANEVKYNPKLNEAPVPYIFK
ncbi:RagB/SusD family nutrient uptake outer membrane protein [Flavobacterium hibisci]|uniref:RagB/SusD family nutrient uptake outer membrane protein n=1 Tax=Flavobacterium hibisci TaxID=1914462 RepID=UPI001CC0E3B9|nr:RagB/SusD family nutrient uptake outer membrane protein [Flavobacterium hibisci]MBZ4042999.1 RagB/SusD family nutrient uptake outer membrane protein [Flavobacterium hibisci]